MLGSLFRAGAGRRGWQGGGRSRSRGRRGSRGASSRNIVHRSGEENMSNFSLQANFDMV